MLYPTLFSRIKQKKRAFWNNQNIQYDENSNTINKFHRESDELRNASSYLAATVLVPSGTVGFFHITQFWSVSRIRESEKLQRTDCTQKFFRVLHGSHYRVLHHKLPLKINSFRKIEMCGWIFGFRCWKIIELLLALTHFTLNSNNDLKGN